MSALTRRFARRGGAPRPRVSTIPLPLARVSAGLVAAGLVAAALVAPGPASAAPTPLADPPPKVPVMTGAGGAVSSVDADATQVGIDVLAAGGNAVDAAVATAAALGVTEPYSAGIGGGGFLIYYDAGSRTVRTIDGRETAPASFTPSVFTDGSGTPLNVASVVSSGLSVGVPGTPAVWETALAEFGTRSLRTLLRPAQDLAEDGFVVDETFAQQTRGNETRFRQFPETVEVYLPDGQVPVVGSTFRNPDLARAYKVLRRQGADALYDGRLGRALVKAARTPRTVPGLTVPGGQITLADVRAYETVLREPTRSTYGGLFVYGMPVPSSGGIAVGEALNLLEAYARSTGAPLSEADTTQYLHRLAEATATAFADRNRYVGDVWNVPSGELLSQGFADERSCQLFRPDAARERPIPFGDPDGEYACPAPPVLTAAPGSEDQGTTNLVTADRWGNVAVYTLTIEAAGGSGITVPGYGFLLNNELTDFNFVPATPGVDDPNLPGPGKRPRSSMSPTIVLDGDRPVLALGSPGGASIITTVTQVVTEHLDRGRPLVEAIAAPRLSSRNAATSQAEPAIIDGPEGAALTALGHRLVATPELGAATAVRLLPDGRFESAAETTRRGGGSAMVVDPE